MNLHTNNSKQPRSFSLLMQYESQDIAESLEKKIIVINQTEAEFSLLMIESLKEKFGNDIVVLTQDQAVAEGVFDSNSDSEIFKISSRRPFKEYKYTLSGKEKRRERRLKERSNYQLQRI